ncbi:hypothetical protein ABZ815_48645 [Nonomuraea sp. NPDC047529]|uniref:hypothetical protein n=1 Tax=Nonomuraea sp. NPDC047529 TaxID=3155623 RepID=UPI00340365A8
MIGLPGTDHERFKQWSEAFLGASAAGAEARMAAFTELVRWLPWTGEDLAYRPRRLPVLLR